ncbi:hypothetical protein [Pseudozobellia thermophila]|uniref:Outer membrane protein beta-barrel domain-containing protein n=1 Tax=Pseudozobellia thermophila TaxID=192903 RepID=A0A1M6MJF3_9FLAO|nr:hypothetical protein [Pseudozobellia thermophila]SHJ83577.1 hypothetical protein SAMN04488513_11016 [Pseudozobellia thermophila]
MIKRIVILLFCGLAYISVHAQEGFKIGAQAGLPLGDFNERIGVVIGADMGYMWAPNKIFDLGIKTGIIHGFAEEFREGTILEDLPSFQFAPLAASVRIWPSKTFSFGGDIGQAFGLNEGNDGGLYIRPQLGFQVGPKSEVNFSYTSINVNDEKWATVTLAYVYTFLSARHFR